jgi:hypothetical protein
VANPAPQKAAGRSGKFTIILTHTKNLLKSRFFIYLEIYILFENIFNILEKII